MNNNLSIHELVTIEVALKHTIKHYEELAENANTPDIRDYFENEKKAVIEVLNKIKEL